MPNAVDVVDLVPLRPRADECGAHQPVNHPIVRFALHVENHPCVTVVVEPWLEKPTGLAFDTPQTARLIARKALGFAPFFHVQKVAQNVNLEKEKGAPLRKSRAKRMLAGL